MPFAFWNPVNRVVCGYAAKSLTSCFAISRRPRSHDERTPDRQRRTCQQQAQTRQVFEHLAATPKPLATR